MSGAGSQRSVLHSGRTRLQRADRDEIDRTTRRPSRLARVHTRPAAADPAGQTLALRPRTGAAAVLSGRASHPVAAVA